MLPQIENPTNKLDIVNSKKEINIHAIFMGNKIHCDICEYLMPVKALNQSKNLVTIKH